YLWTPAAAMFQKSLALLVTNASFSVLPPAPPGLRSQPRNNKPQIMNAIENFNAVFIDDAPLLIRRGGKTPPLLAHIKLMHRQLRIRLPRLHDNRWKIRMIHRIGVMLRLQAKSPVLFVNHAVLALEVVQKIAGVQLHARLGGPDFHGALALGI